MRRIKAHMAGGFAILPINLSGDGRLKGAAVLTAANRHEAEKRMRLQGESHAADETEPGREEGGERMSMYEMISVALKIVEIIIAIYVAYKSTKK